MLSVPINSYFYKMMESPVGLLTLVSNEHSLVAILWEKDRIGRVNLSHLKKHTTHPILCKTHQQLEEYFNKKRKQFDLPLEFMGTPFQVKVWKQLKTIPFGQTRSYSDLARNIDNPRACRAVGAANGRNPLSIVVPCHRVIGSNGQLTGFAGGLHIKKYLLDSEK